MKTAYLISRYPAVNHTYILREVRGLRELGMDVQVASILPADRANAELSLEEREEAANTFYVRPRGAARIVADQIAFGFSYPAAFIRGLVFALRMSRWNLRLAVSHLLYVAEAVVVGRWMSRNGLCHAHTHFASTPVLFLEKMFAVTISATIHGPAEFNDAVGFLLPEKVAAAKFIIAISSYGASQIMRVAEYRYWEKIHVARLGVDPAEFVPSPERKDGFNILFVGQLVPAKGVHILVQACSSLLRKGYTFRLRLVGDGPERNSLAALVAELQITANVVFEGALDHHRVLEIYRTASLFAMASFAEGIPVVLMEAMAMEIPCVSTRIMGIPELIQDGVEGLLVTPADADALAGAIAQLIANPELYASLSRAGREKVVRDFNCARNVEHLHAILVTALA